MKASDRNDPRLREIGERRATDAYEMAAELNTYGADASVLLLSKAEQRSRKRPPEVCIPTAFADALMAILLSLPRPQIGRRPLNWSPQRVQASMQRGMSLRAAAKKEAGRTGKPAEDIARTMRAQKNARKKARKK
jgi:hypothetical protein